MAMKKREKKLDKGKFKIKRTQRSPKKMDSKSPKGKKKKKDKNQKIAMTFIKETYGEGRKRLKTIKEYFFHKNHKIPHTGTS